MEQNIDKSGALWLPNKKRPLVISGPCSAETKEQVLETSRRLFETGKVDVLRAGVWKPRTRPGSFEGVGPKALPWLTEVKEMTGLPVAVEVANAYHVELCLEFGIDILWIGARTSVNPFAVQEIADALRGTDIPVLMKNPINADLALWQGGIERLIKSGLKRVGSIHRGFSNLGEKHYRNRPQWQLAIAFKNEMPEIPLICDPSHICGRRDILTDVAQKSMDLGFDGLMIESHIDPDNAWSDASQQITPEQVKELLSELVLRDDKEDDKATQSKLDLLRQQINHIDDEILNLLSNRMNVVREIGAYKRDNDITILQQKRWNKIINKGKHYASLHGLNEEFIIKYLQNIHDESINQQEVVMKEKKK